MTQIEGVIPAANAPRFARFFAGYSRRMLRRSFASVRLTIGSREALDAIETSDRPAIVALNHASWWDPLVGLVLAREYAPTRTLASPIDAAQLRKFKFLRKVGLFGIDPTDRGSLRSLVDHACSLFESDPRTLLGLTPQGAFTDVRSPVRVRPGIGAIASRLSSAGAPPLVTSIACEYCFWFDKKPDLLLHARPVAPPDGDSTASWTRAIASAMDRDRLFLAERSIARDEDAFEPLFPKAGSGVHPVYDLLLRLAGKRPEIRPNAPPPHDQPCSHRDKPASGQGVRIESSTV